MTYHLGVNMSSPDFFLDSARGVYNNISSVNKFGAVPAMSQNNTGTIWDVDDTEYPWSSFASAGTLSVPAVNASDNGKTIRIIGLNASYDLIQEVVTVSSAEATATTSSFIRVVEAFITNGSAINVADINVQKGGVTVMRITAGKAVSHAAIYTVPAGYTAYIMKGAATCQDGADATGDMYVRYFGEASFRVGHSFEFSGAGGEYMYDFGIPLRIPEKSDIDIRATVRSNNARITAAFDIMLIADKS